MNDWDFIVIGAGSAGCAVAHELLQSGRNRVLVLEAGGSNKSPYIKVFALVVQAGKRFNWGYVSAPDPSRGNRTENWLRGRVVGGTSSINGTIFVRGAPHDFDQWAALGNRGRGNEGWSYDDVLPIFRDMETYDRAGASRGRSGPLHVRTVRKVHPLTDAFIKSAVAAGFPLNADYNDGSQEGVSYIQLSQRRGLRFSAADAFIEPLKSRRNFKLELNAHVDRILLAEGRATGVAHRQRGVTRTVSGRHVVLCGGAINTPQLLMLSGIGDPVELKRHGINVVAELPEVGKNLKEHPLVRLVFCSRIPSNNQTRGLLQKLHVAAQFGWYRQGPMSTLFEAVGFLKTSADLDRPDVQLHFAPLGYLDFANESSPFLPYPSFSVVVNKNYPKSRGRIRLTSGPGKAPLIEPSLLGDPEDLETLVRGIGLVRRVIAASPMAELAEEEVVPGRAIADAALRRYVPEHTELAYHPIGTCRMGPDPAAVVTPQLRVNGFRNLWIADASIMPDHISGNTNAACMMIGMKLGRYLHELRD